MNAPATISRRGRASRAANFERLREQGMAHVQALCGQTWTDHNLHDPGITILEQLCFALTELVYRADFDVADQLTGPDGQIDFEGLSLHPPQLVFPCRATTAADYRRLLLDRVPGLDDAALLQRHGSHAGVYTLQLNLAHSRAWSEAERSRQALATYRSQRNLGEDVEPRPLVLQEHWCGLDADIEIGGPREAAEILAEVYDTAARLIDRAASFTTLAEERAAVRSWDDLLDGPFIPHGIAANPARHRGERLYVAELAERVRRIDGVREVRSLRLTMAESSAPPGPLLWGGDTWTLALLVPFESTTEAAHRGVDRVMIQRRGQQLHVPASELRRRYEELQAAHLAQRGGVGSDTRAGGRQAWPDALPRGRYRQAAPYHSVQHHFPAVYGLGRHGVPPSAGAQAQAKSRQLASYLLLFEQLIANGAAQLAHLLELFSINGGSAQSYWWQMLEPLPETAGSPADASQPVPQVPGLQGLLIGSPQSLQAEVFAPFDPGARRKHRVLDHLLALHGETLTQNAMRQFCHHLSPRETDALLLDQKVKVLADIVRLGQDRAGGFDYSQPSWDRPDNCTTLVRRTCRLLGFAHAHSRPLCRRRVHLRLPQTLGLDSNAARVEASRAAEGQRLDFDACEPSEQEASSDLEAAAQPGQPPSDPVLLRSGVTRSNYRLLPCGKPGADEVMLLLGPDRQGQWRSLGKASDAAAATRYAARLRAMLLRLNEDSEGLHVVEHVLLRPLAHRPQATHAEKFHHPAISGQRVTAVLPGWTVRTEQKTFRELAEETLRLNCPAHLALSFKWLDFDAMLAFETAYAEWLDQRVAHGRGEASAEQVDAAAVPIIDALLPPRSSLIRRRG